MQRATVLDLINPFCSPFSTVPATTSPFAALKNLQVTEGNVPIWSNPISFGYYLFVQEMSKSGVDGGLDSVTSAGLLSQRQWESLYRFVAVDIGRRLPSENGASKSIIVSGTSSCNYALTIYSHVLREVVATVDTAIGTVSQGPTKQNAFDRYYNAMAKSDFVQGNKLKALILKENLDDASTDSLAHLFQQVMGKNREYEYDQITKKQLKGSKYPPEIIKGEASETPKSSKKKHTYVPKSTDADFNMDEPTAPEESFEDFFSGVNDVAQKSLKEVVDDPTLKHLNKQREFRRKESNRRRQEMAANHERIRKASKRKRTTTPPNKPPTDKRATKKTAKRAEEEPSITRQLFQDSDVSESSDDEEIKEEKRLRGSNAGIKTYKSQFAAKLNESIRHRFGEAVDQRKGKAYFEANAPEPPRKHHMKRDAMNQYKAEMKGWLNGIFIETERCSSIFLKLINDFY
ncbi:hypothetical protein GN244_ATG14476 [Phytophthora infestans]|uniref:Uncharacterized protein n=1 Tax=Phytophthora infestans TaxID=4787 RepID=A0A833SHM0_PHYIN|nr:hypothetical protein GN244_ATG14476 [Phytophthora infestans]